MFLVLNEVLNKMKRAREKTCKIIHSIRFVFARLKEKFQF